MIKAIVFDYGGVVEVGVGDLIHDVSVCLGVSVEEWRKVYLSLNYLCSTGKKSYEEVFIMTAKELGASDEKINEMIQMMRKDRENTYINTELVEIIKKLRSNGYKVALLSNNNIKLRQELIDLKLIDLFDSVIISAEVGCYKPQLEIFEILFKELDVKSNEVVFVDDSESSLAGAENIGYIPILFIGNGKLKEELERLDIKI